MDEFTDGLEITENDTLIESPTDTEPVLEQETPEQSSSVSDSTDLTDEPEKLTEPEQVTETPEQSTEIPEQEVTADQEISYEDLLKELSAQTEEIKAIHEIEINRQEFYDNIQNMGLVLVAASGLICGCICALILANYLRH